MRGQNQKKMNDILIEIRDLHFRRGNLKVFDGIDIDIHRGHVT